MVEEVVEKDGETVRVEQPIDSVQMYCAKLNGDACYDVGGVDVVTRWPGPLRGLRPMMAAHLAHAAASNKVAAVGLPT